MSVVRMEPLLIFCIMFWTCNSLVIIGEVVSGFVAGCVSKDRAMVLAHLTYLAGLLATLIVGFEMIIRFIVGVFS